MKSRGLVKTQAAGLLKGNDAILVVNVDPTVTAVAGFENQLVLSVLTGIIYQKNADDGVSTSWVIYSTGGGGGSLIVDTVMNVDNIQFDGASVVDDGGGQVTVTIAPASNNQFIYRNNSGVLEGALGFFRDNNSGGFSVNVDYQPDNLGVLNIHPFNLNLNPIQNSPNDSYNLFNNTVNVDTLSSGFSIGTSQNLITFHNNSLGHTGESNVGAVVFYTNYFNIGNGVDPIDVRGFSYMYGFGDINNNVNVIGQMQGYGFQPNANSGATFDAAQAGVNAFYDFALFSNNTLGFYNTFTASPQIGSIQNNFNYTALNVNPTINNFIGNASFYGVNVNSILGDFDSGVFLGLNIAPIINSITTGTFFGINIVPNIASVDNSIGIFVDMSNAVGTNNIAARFIGDVDIIGQLSFTGALTVGNINAFSSVNVVDGGGNPATINNLITQITAPNSQVTANADTIGVNTASLMIFEAGSITTSGPFTLGICPLALSGIVTMETTATVEHVRASAFVLNLENTSTGGTIQNAIACWAAIIPNGITMVNRYVGYDATLPFGAPNADDSWGYFCGTNIYNYMAGSLVVGGSQDKTTNQSIAIEIESTTKAFMNARMTTVERNALTALNGMQIYNSTTDRLQVYAGGAWVDLH